MSDLAERYRRAEALLPPNALARIHGLVPGVRWIGEGGAFWYRVRREEGARFVRVEPGARTARPAFDHAALAAALGARLGRSVETGALPFREIAFEGDAVLFEAEGARLAFDGARLRDAPPTVPAEYLASPDGRHAVRVRDHDLHLLDLVTGAGRRLTGDGEPHHAWGAEPGGTMDALSGVPAPPAAAWSPCGRRLLVFRCDERAVPEIAIPDARGRPSADGLRVPLVGDAVTRTASYWILDVETGARRRVDVPPFAAMESPFWFARQGLPGPRFWSADGALHLTRRGAGARSQTLYRVDPETGAATALIREKDTIPVLLNAFEFGAPLWRVLGSTGEILWFSQADGWGQLFLHAPDGRRLRQIGAGRYVQRDLLALDEGARTLWTSAAGLCPSSNPYRRHLLRASLDGGPPERLTPEPVEHVLGASPCGRWFVDFMGTPEGPARTVLRGRDGAEVMALEEADASGLGAAGWRAPEPASVPAADGETELRAALFVPSDFDPARRYPVLDMIYGWSQVTVVPHGPYLDTGGPLDGGLEIAAENAFLPAATAELGFVVVVIDGRGTPYRHRDVWAPAFTDPAMATGLADHAAAIRALAATRPWMDLGRVGLFGHSGGGHMAAKGLMLHPDLFRAAVASAGNHDMRLYHAAWADQWGATPDALAASSVRAQAARLEGALLLAHGERDENVHVAHTLQLADALTGAGKDYELMILPGRHHDFVLEPAFVRRRWDFLVRHVSGEAPLPARAPTLVSWEDAT